MVATDVARRVGGFGAGRFAEDLELWLRILARNPGVVPLAITVRYAATGVRASDDPRAMRAAAQEVVRFLHPGLRIRSRRGLAVTADWDWCRRPSTNGRARMGTALCRTRWTEHRERLGTLLDEIGEQQ